MHNWADCLNCGAPPVDPERVEGHLLCRTCTSPCTQCGSAGLPGEDLCPQCHLIVFKAEITEPPQAWTDWDRIVRAAAALGWNYQQVPTEAPESGSYVGFRNLDNTARICVYLRGDGHLSWANWTGPWVSEADGGPRWQPGLLERVIGFLERNACTHQEAS